MEHKEELDTIKMWLFTGAISYNKAKELAAPHISAMNAKAKEIAGKYNVKAKSINFASYMR